jgi:hypothetical protein
MKANINANAKAALELKIEQLNNRAERYNFPKLSVSVCNEWSRIADDDGNRIYPEQWFTVDIDGLNPRINGFRLIAKIENDSTIGTMVKIIPGVDDDGSFAQYRSHDYSCDHCCTRRNRSAVFVLESAEGRKVIGRNCLADYIRTENAEALADWAEFISEFDFTGKSDSEVSDLCESWGGGRVEPASPLDKFLQVVSVIIRRIGWTSRSQAYDEGRCSSTADLAELVAWGKGSYRAELVREKELYPSEEDSALVEKALEWAQSVDSSKSEYLETIKRVALVGMVTRNTTGYAASIISSYRKHCERQAQVVTTTPKAYVGTVGERVRNLPIKMVGTTVTEGFYGPKTVVRMQDMQGNPIVWFASGYKEFTEGAEYKMTARITEHKDHPKFGIQTIVQRATIA